MSDHCPFGLECICGASIEGERHWVILLTGGHIFGVVHFLTDVGISIILSRPFVNAHGYTYRPGEKVRFRPDTIKEVIVGD